MKINANEMLMKDEESRYMKMKSEGTNHVHKSI